MSNVCKSYEGRPVLQHVSFTAGEDRPTCLRAPSGTGKTTLLRLLLGLEQPDSGTITYPTPCRWGVVFQENRLLEHLDAMANLRFAAGPALEEERARGFLRELGLEEAGDRIVRAYSGGMKRRLSLAVALVHEPAVLVLDEPTVGLDPEHRRYIWNHLEALAAQGCAIVVTTHVMDEAERCARIAMIREGRLIADAAPADILARTGTSTLEDAFLALEESESSDTAAEPNVSPSLGEKEACHD